MPPPMHSVARPFLASCRAISCSSVTSTRAPDAPIGWPRAMAPPLTLTLPVSQPRSLLTARAWAAKASLASIRSRSSTDQPASRKALEQAGWTVDDLDLIEANEAFAAQALAVNKDLGWDTGKVNVNGGAIALGHPIGASGARVLVTLLHEMARRDAKKGLATLCIGGGMGIALCVER